jgi:hypothetical protein
MDIRTMAPTTLDITKSVQIPPNTTPTADVITTPLIETTTKTKTTIPPTTTTTTTTTVELTTATERVQTTEEFTTTTPFSAVRSAETTAAKISPKVTTVKPHVKVGVTITKADEMQIHKHWTEVPVVAKVIHTDPNMKGK